MDCYITIITDSDNDNYRFRMNRNGSSKNLPCFYLYRLTSDQFPYKGVSFMENQVGWHGKAPSKEDLAKALAELGVEE